jgi:nitrogen fixation protein NifU and related proteins
MDDVNFLDELYKEEIMDHYSNPRNSGELEGANIRYRDYNPVCGDEVEIQAKVCEDVIENVMFKGKGCAISQAAASMLTDKVKGMKIVEVMKFGKEDILKMLMISPGPVRIKCALLALRALQKGVLKYETVIALAEESK